MEKIVKEVDGTSRYEVIMNDDQKVPIKAFTVGVMFEDSAKAQLRNIAKLPFIHEHVAVMPDVHLGIGATVGSVVPTLGAIIPAAVGVDIGCGMMAVRTSLKQEDLPGDLPAMRTAIEKGIPHGRTDHGGANDRGSWSDTPGRVEAAWMGLEGGYRRIVGEHAKVAHGFAPNQLGTLGGGNHFVEVCIDNEGSVWFMLHSGSRGIGNKIGTYFTELAKEDMRKYFINLPDANLAYLPEGTEHFKEYVHAVNWAQQYAAINRELMMQAVIEAVKKTKGTPSFQADLMVVNCHHNYVAQENHYGKNVFVTRKGAVRARRGDFGIIPGSMGAKSFIVRGKGCEESFHSCSHGAGRAMSRTEARKRFTLKDHRLATEGVECRKDSEVIDETPAAYKPIAAVMDAQKELVDILFELRQIICVKG